MQPVAHHRMFSGVALGLQDFRLVVRELQVAPAAVDVELRPQQRQRHRRALDVPAGTARAPRAFPRRLALARALPECEVGRVALARVDRDPRTRLELIERLAGQRPELLARRGDVEVDVGRQRPLGRLGDVGVPLRYQIGNDRDHLLDIVGRARHLRRRPHAERRQVGGRARDVAVGQLRRRDSLLRGAGDNLVIDVGVVLDMLDRVAGVLEPAPYGVERDVAPRVAEVHVVIDRQSADVHSHLAGLARRELLECAAGAVVDFQHVT